MKHAHNKNTTARVIKTKRECIKQQVVISRMVTLPTALITLVDIHVGCEIT